MKLTTSGRPNAQGRPRLDRLFPAKSGHRRSIEDALKELAVSPIASLLDAELPVIQAPMAGVQDAALAIAVSEAGGLGSMPCAMLDTAPSKLLSNVRTKSSLRTRG